MVLSRSKAAEVLGVSQNASDEEVTAAYRRLALKWHPDQSPSPHARDRFHQVGQAYKRLCPECRDIDTSDSEDEDDYGEGEMFDIFNLVMQREFHRIRTRFQGTNTTLGRMMQDPGFSRDWIKLFQAYDDLMQRGDVEEDDDEEDDEDDYSEEEGYDPDEYDGRYWSEDSEGDEDLERRLKDARAGIGEPEERIKAEWKRKMELRRLRYVHEERKAMKNSHTTGVAQKDDEEARRRADEIARELLEEEEREKRLASGKSKAKKAKGTADAGKAAQSPAENERDEDAQDDDDNDGEQGKGGKKLTKAEKKKRQEERKAEAQKLKKAEKRAVQKQRKKMEKEGNDDEKSESGDDFDEESAFVAMFAAKKGKPAEAAPQMKTGSTVLAGKGVVLIPDASIENNPESQEAEEVTNTLDEEVPSTMQKMETLGINGEEDTAVVGKANGQPDGDRSRTYPAETLGNSAEHEAGVRVPSESGMAGSKVGSKGPNNPSPNSVQGPSQELSDAYIHEQIRLRKVARERKDFKSADAIRDTMLARGVLLEDRGRLTTFKRIDPSIPHIPDPSRARNRENRHENSTVEESGSVNGEGSKNYESFEGRKAKSRQAGAEAESSRCEVFIGNVRKDVPLSMLKRALSEYGEIVGDIKLQTKSSSALATFETVDQAMAAIKGLNGQVIGRARFGVIMKMSYNNSPSIIQASKSQNGGPPSVSSGTEDGGSLPNSPPRVHPATNSPGGAGAYVGSPSKHPDDSVHSNGQDSMMPESSPKKEKMQIEGVERFGQPPQIPAPEPSIRMPSSSNVSTTHGTNVFRPFDPIPVDGDMDLGKSIDSEGSENDSMKSRYQRSLMNKALLAFDSYALSEQEKMAGIQRAINSPKTATIFEKWRRLPSLSELRGDSDGYDPEMVSNSRMSKLGAIGGAIGQRKGPTRSRLESYPEQDIVHQQNNQHTDGFQGMTGNGFQAMGADVGVGSEYLAAQKMHSRHTAVRSVPQSQWEDAGSLRGMPGAQSMQSRQMGFEMNSSQGLVPGAGAFGSSQPPGPSYPTTSQNGNIAAQQTNTFGASRAPGSNAGYYANNPGYYGQMAQGQGSQGFAPGMPGQHSQRMQPPNPARATEMSFTSPLNPSVASHGFPSDPMSLSDQGRLAHHQQQPRQAVQWNTSSHGGEPNWSVGHYQSQNDGQDQWMQQPVPMYQGQWMQQQQAQQAPAQAQGFQQHYSMAFQGGGVR